MQKLITLAPYLSVLGLAYVYIAFNMYSHTHGMGVSCGPVGGVGGGVGTLGVGGGIGCGRACLAGGVYGTCL
jgi:hypothetical protein